VWMDDEEGERQYRKLGPWQWQGRASEDGPRTRRWKAKGKDKEEEDDNLKFSTHIWTDYISGFDIFWNRVFLEVERHKTHRCNSFHPSFLQRTCCILPYRTFLFPPSSTYSFP
jgi:hypothetical protein